MAEEIDKPIPDDLDEILYVEVEFENVKSYRGFKMEYLAQNLTEIEINFVFCPKCSGIIREACSIQEGNVCLRCCANEEDPKPENKLRSLVSKLEIKCPLLRDCGWAGILLEGEKHLKDCGIFILECPLECGTVLKRCEIDNHVENRCPHRTVRCHFCEQVFQDKLLSEHLTVCHAHPIRCECEREIRRDELNVHIDTVCTMTEIECPYTKYGCKIGKILRKDLLAHKKEFFIEHQDIIEKENCKLKEEQNQLKHRHEKMEEIYLLLNIQHHELNVKHDQLNVKHDQLNEKHDQLNEKHDQLNEKHNQLNEKHDQLKVKNGQLTRKHDKLDVMLEQECYQMKQTLRIKKQLNGIVVNFTPQRGEIKNLEFDIGSYSFNCMVHVGDSINIRLNRRFSLLGSDRNIICITGCVVCLESTAKVKGPFFSNKQLSSRIATGESICLMELKNDIYSQYTQPDGTVNMGVYFDYDYCTCKGIFS